MKFHFFFNLKQCIAMLPKEILINIALYLNLEDELRFIEIFNLPKRIPRKLNINKLEKINNLLCHKCKIDLILCKIYSSMHYVDLTYAYESEYKNIIIKIINNWYKT